MVHSATDFSESKDLASAQPDKVKQLQALYDTWNKAQAEPSAPDAPAGKAKNKNKAKSKAS